MLTLEQVLDFRSQLVTLKNLFPELQVVARKRLLSELCRSGETYYLRRLSDNRIHHVTLPKVFIFVVLPSRPTQVLCIQQISEYTRDEIYLMRVRRFSIMGHASITRNSPVLYAGQLVLENNSLFAWDNCSGHYEPAPDLHERNFLPPVKHLLPSHKMVRFDADEDVDPVREAYYKSKGRRIIDRDYSAPHLHDRLEFL